MVNRTVLIIDDTEAFRRRVERVLAATGLFSEIITANDGIEGFKVLLSRPIDLILCDLVMPGFDGYKFLSLRQSKPEFHEVPVIMLTGEEQVRAKVRGLDAGASDYLTKPFHDEELVARVKVHLKIKALQDELRDKNTRLEELSRTDELTGLCNRRYFMEQLRMEFLRAKRYALPLVFAMADVDHFKAVNDNYGHLVGDQALVNVADALAQTVRVHDIVGRYGGEEFCIVMPHTNFAGGSQAAERCRLRVQESGLRVDSGDVLKVTVSLGVVCLLGGNIETVEELIRIADEALYEAKDRGRNCAVIVRQDG